jgi:hypothetical protein
MNWDTRWTILALLVLRHFPVVSKSSIIETAQLEPYPSTTNRKVAHIGVLLVSLSVSLNVVVTFMICFRLLQM